MKKKLIFMYVEDAFGFQKTGFNFSTKEYFYVSFDRDNLILNGNKTADCLLEGFWGKNISELHLLIGDNGSGKTTIMTILFHWMHQLSQGCLPQEKGIVIFQIEDRMIYIGFDGGEELPVYVKANNDLRLEHYHINQFYDFFDDLRLVYFSNTMTGLSIKGFKKLSDYSLANRIAEANKYEYVAGDNIIDNYKQYEFNNQIDTALNINEFPIQYLRMEIFLLSFEEIKRLLPEVQGKDLMEFWEYYFGSHNQKNVSCKKKLGINLLQAVFIGIIVKLIKWEQDSVAEENEKIILKLFKRILDSESKMHGRNRLYMGKIWIEVFLRDLFQHSKQEYVKGKYKNKFLSSWKNYRIEDIEQIIELLFEYIEKGTEDFLEEWESIFSSTEKSVWQWKLRIENRTVFKRFWEMYKNIVLYVDFIKFDWNASSGERNWVSLFSVLQDASKTDKNIWFFLDEPDITFHPEWKRKLVKKIVEACNGRNFDNKLVQIWISTHSPIMLSDIPGGAVGYLRKKKKWHSPFKETFGQNIYVLYNNAFTLKNGVIGSFATGKILDVLIKLEEIERNLLKGQEINSQLIEEMDVCEKIINLVAEPVFKRQMQLYLKRCKNLLKRE